MDELKRKNFPPATNRWVSPCQLGNGRGNLSASVPDIHQKVSWGHDRTGYARLLYWTIPSQPAGLAYQQLGGLPLQHFLQTVALWPTESHPNSVRKCSGNEAQGHIAAYNRQDYKNVNQHLCMCKLRLTTSCKQHEHADGLQSSPWSRAASLVEKPPTVPPISLPNERAIVWRTWAQFRISSLVTCRSADINELQTISFLCHSPSPLSIPPFSPKTRVSR